MLLSRPLLGFVVCLAALIVTAQPGLGQIDLLTEDFSTGDLADWQPIDNMQSTGWGPGIYDVRDEALHLESSDAVPAAQANDWRASLFANWLPTNDPVLANGILRVKARVDEPGNGLILGMRFQGESTAYGFEANSSDGAFRIGSYRGSPSFSTHVTSATSEFREETDWQFEMATIDDREQ